MNPQAVFCRNIDCPAKGRTGQGNIGVHDRKDKRCVCHECKCIFSATKGTLLYRLHSDPVTVLLVYLAAYGCPPQAIVMAYGFDERTVKQWWRRSGEHCRVVHEHMIEQRQFNLGQVQADEIKAKMQGASVWLAMAIMVSTRLWLGGVVGASRNQELIEALVAKVRRMALCRPLLLTVDGLASYVSAFQSAFRSPLPRHCAPGRPRLVAWQDITIVQVVKRRTPAGMDIVRRIVQGHETLVMRLLKLLQSGGVINTAYIERLNAPFRQRLAHLTRRARCLARQIHTLTSGMYVVGCFYNFCDYHQSLRLPLWITERRRHWVQRTPAMAASITDHRWTLHELFWFKVPPAPWTPPKRRGRPSKQLLQLAERGCS